MRRGYRVAAKNCPARGRNWPGRYRSTARFRLRRLLDRRRRLLGSRSRRRRQLRRLGPPSAHAGANGGDGSPRGLDAAAGLRPEEVDPPAVPERLEYGFPGPLPVAEQHPQSGQGQRPAEDRQPQVERSEEHTSELQSLAYLVCRLLLEKKKKKLYYLLLITKKKNKTNQQ